jgi:Transposase, Mutator family
MAIDGTTVNVAGAGYEGKRRYYQRLAKLGAPGDRRRAMAERPHAFLTSVKQRGLRGVRLVVSDQHAPAS